MNNSLGVVLVDPVDVYLQAQRASKYGILFIGLTFTAFFLFEVLRKIAMCPRRVGMGTKPFVSVVEYNSRTSASDVRSVSLH